MTATPTGNAHSLVVRGAREHNLRDVVLDLPRDSLIVFTGLSGSGKSSLAFDTIFAEGQRRYVESLSAYARQFLGQMDKPDVDFIEGLSPAVSIDQKSTNRNPRSTVGTITEVYDYLRLLFARAGRPHCPVCGEPITRQTPQQIVDQLLDCPRTHPVPGARPRRPGPQGRVRRPLRRAPDQGLLPRPRRRRGRLARRAADAREAAEAHDRGRRRPPRRPRATTRPSAGSPTRSRPRSGLAGGVVVIDFVDRDAEDHGPRAPLLREAGLPQRPPAAAGRDRAAVVLVQLARSAPARSAPASAPSSRSTPSSSCPTTTCRSPRVPSRRGPRAPARPSTSSA